MIGQNRQSTFQQAKADNDFEVQYLELKTNTELTRQIHLLTVELHRRLIERPASGSPGPTVSRGQARSLNPDGIIQRAYGRKRHQCRTEPIDSDKYEEEAPAVSSDSQAARKSLKRALTPTRPVAIRETSSTQR